MKSVHNLLLSGVIALGMGLSGASAANRCLPSCKAHFTWSQTAPNTIVFSDTSSTGLNPSTTFHWVFSDGTRVTGSNPTHVFNIPGTYNVCLRISDSTRCFSTFCDTVHVTGTVVCNLSVNTRSNHPSCSICQDGSAIANANGGTRPYTYSWSNGATTAYDYHLNPGVYSVCVTDANGCKACTNDTIKLRPSTCQAHFTSTATGANTLSFNDSSSVHTTTHTEYEWSFGDGKSAHGSNPSHTFLIPGLYTVCLTIEDTGGCYNKFCDTLRVAGKVICTLITDASQHHASCDTCHNGYASVSASGGTTPFHYSWSNGATTRSIRNILPGIYTVCVTDTNGCKSCTIITVTSGHKGGCDAEFDIEADTAKVGNYLVTNYSSGKKPLHYSWSWGDGSAADTTAAPSHTYATPGIYQICLTIVDSTGCTSSECENMPEADERHSRYLVTNQTSVQVRMAADMTTGITEQSVLNDWNLFPNPSSSVTTLRYTLLQNASVTITIFDLAGKQVMNLRAASVQNAGQHDLAFDSHSLAPGTYLVGIRCNEKLTVKRISVLRD
jgi:PKD repeat protein